jgi:DNA polymerase eta
MDAATLPICIRIFRYNPFGRLQETASHDIQRRLIVKNGSIQCKDDANGSLIAVSYEARAAGVKRNDRGIEAIAKCPLLNIVQVPVKRGKADLSMYRSASARVFKVLVDSIQSHSNCTIPVEVASIDEVYLDVTETARHVLENKQNSWDELIAVASGITTVGGIETITDDVYAANALNRNQVRKGSHMQIHDATRVDQGSLGWWFRTSEFWNDAERMLAVGAFLAAHARAAVLEAFGSAFTLSGGISSNKTLAKLASGLKKPNRQTLINWGNRDTLEKLFYPLPLDRIRGLGVNWVSSSVNASR